VSRDVSIVLLEAEPHAGKTAPTASLARTQPEWLAIHPS
jgi:hypothetical protein